MRKMANGALKGGLATQVVLALVVFASFFGALLYATGHDIHEEKYWKALAISGEPEGCFPPGSGGNYPTGGSFFGTFLNVSSFAFGWRTTFSFLVGGALSSAACTFLLYLCMKRVFGAPAALGASALRLFLENYVPLVEMHSQETGLQAFFSVFFFFIFLERAFSKKMGKETPGASGAILAGLVAGMGFFNKIYFAAFLVSLGVSAFFAREGRLLKLRELPLILLGFLIGAFPFIWYNISLGFPTISFLSSADELFSLGGFLFSLPVRLAQTAFSAVPFVPNFFSIGILFAFFLAVSVLGYFLSDPSGRRALLLVAFLVGFFAIFSSISYWTPQAEHIDAMRPFFPFLFLSVFCSILRILPAKFPAFFACNSVFWNGGL